MNCKLLEEDASEVVDGTEKLESSPPLLSSYIP